MKKPRKLTNVETQKYADHLIRLSPEDRYLRFAATLSDDRIQRYVDAQFKTKQVVIASMNRSKDVVAAIEIVFDRSRYVTNNELVEIGLSVEEPYRNQGLGTELFGEAVALARERGAKTLLSHCLGQNRWMMRIAKKYKMKVQSEANEGGEILLESASPTTQPLGDGMTITDYSTLKTPAVFNYGKLMTFSMWLNHK